MAESQPLRVLLTSVVVATLIVLAGCSGLAGDASESADSSSTPAAQSSPSSASADTTAPVDGAMSRLPAAEPLNGTRSLTDADVTVRGVGADELGFGAAVGDVNGDGTPDLVVGAPFHNASETRAGAVFVFFGPVAPGELTVEDADVQLLGEGRGDWAGNSLAIDDVSDDGVDDLIVGAPRRGPDNVGGVYVLYGGSYLDGTISLGTANATLTGAVPDSLAGYSIAAANVTGGPAADIVIGAPRANTAGPNSGAAYLVDGRNVETTGSLTQADATFSGATAEDRAGRAVAVAGDVDGDDHPDLVIGARGADGASNGSGAAYLVTTTGYPERASLADAAVTLAGVESNDDAGFDVSGAGDVNDDGLADVLVGAPLNDAGGRTAGAAYVVHGSSDLPERVNLSDAAVRFSGAPGDRAGYSANGVGDVTCDGTDDILVGAPENDTGGENAGAAYLVAGGTGGEMSPANATATLTGAAPGDQVGRVDALVAIPGEETTGLVVGAPFGEAPPSVHVVSTGCAASDG